MDMDTTSGKDGHEKIISEFAAHNADVLVGTQMIVKMAMIFQMLHW